MKSFNVILWDFNSSEPEPYDVIPYLVGEYKKSRNKPKTFEEFRNFIKKESMYQWWSRCEYEIIIQRWPPSKKEEGSKWDVYKQVMMNIDIITKILMEELNK